MDGSIKALLPHQERVVQEKRELEERLGKLSVFVHSPGFESVDPAEQDRLKRQHALMVDLNLILEERIAAF
jgi:hypothetical protein